MCYNIFILLMKFIVLYYIVITMFLPFKLLYLFLYFRSWTIDNRYCRNGERQVPFPKPHLVTVTDTMPSTRTINNIIVDGVLARSSRLVELTLVDKLSQSCHIVYHVQQIVMSGWDAVNRGDVMSCNINILS